MDIFSYAYIEYKAIRFLEVGYKIYSKEDAFHQPGEELTPETDAMLTSGCEQIRDQKGLTMEQPIEKLSIGEFYQLMRMFHFKPIRQEISLIGRDFIIDRIIFEHLITGEKQRIELFNKVDKQW
ncbi:MAG TPA: hypothetical protein PLW31_10590 [Bacteroidales bacterium]|nr:hypothetical protein [Bacteroidales bacterium]